MSKKVLFIKLFLFGYFIFLCMNANAQTGIFFQAIARDNYTNPAKDRKIYVQTNIIQSSPTGTIVLIEEHKTNTDAYGIFSIMVGNGERVGGTVTGLSTIDWSKGPYYLNINIAITPVSVGDIWDYRKEWVNLGTTIFGTVPFALFSANTARIDEKLNSTDTAKMLSVYAKALAVQTLSTTIDTKLAIKDTAAMLAPYSKPSYKIDSNFFKIQLANKLDLSDTIKYTKQAYIDSALITKMTSFDTSSYAKKVNVDAALLKKFNIVDTIKYTKQAYTDSALLKKMNNFDTSIYAKQVTLDAALLKKLNNVDSINYTKKAYTDSALLTKMNSFDISTYAKQVTLDAALLTKLSLTDNAVTATTAINAGTATTATKLTTARNINGIAFDGTKDITISTIADAGTLTGTILKSTVTASSLTSVGIIASLTTGAITNSGKLIVGASSAASASAILEVSSTTQGFLPPRMNYYQRTQIASPIAGLTIWCSNCGASGEMQVFNGGAWTNMIGGAATGVITNSGKLSMGASSAASASAVLEVSSTTQGFLSPRMSYYQRKQIASPIAGLTIWCCNCGPSGEMQVFNGGKWTNMIGGTATGTISLSIGQSYQGGKVAYILGSKDPGYDVNTPHGLIAATSDQTVPEIGIKWDRGTYTITGATGTAIGTGLSNTNKIIASQGEPAITYAAGLARAYTGGGYTDWYLPSKDELEKLQSNKGTIGDFYNFYYWSSSEVDESKAWFQFFWNGRQYQNVKGELRPLVRAIRSF
jgi:rRNA-processing protein FCF1